MMAGDGGAWGSPTRRRNEVTTTYFPGLSRSPPRLDSSWQQHRIYRISPSRLYRLCFAAGAAVAAASPWPPPSGPQAGPFREASIRGQHPPTQ